MDKVFQPGILPDNIKHAKPALTVWAVRLVANLVRAEGQQMIQYNDVIYHSGRFFRLSLKCWLLSHPINHVWNIRDVVYHSDHFLD
jgi:hypothetical protein